MLTRRHFEFHCAGSLGTHLGCDPYPIRITEVDEGSPADEQGVPVNSVMVVLNEQQLKQNDGQNVREHVMHKLNEQRVSFDVVTFEELSGFHAAVNDARVLDIVARANPPQEGLRDRLLRLVGAI